MNSRAKGARGEREFIHDHLIEFWPAARRNLEQHTEDKRDSLDTGPLHWQIKRTESLRLWAALSQAEREANGRLPLLAFRRNRSPWYVAGRAELLVPIFSTVGTEVDIAA